MSQFSIENTTVNLNGHTVTGWSDDADCLSMPSVDIAAVKRGADGKQVAASTGEKGGPVILKLLANSPSVKFLQNIMTGQLNGASVEFNGIVRDSLNGISVLLTGGVLTNGPMGPTLGKGEVANREYTIEFERIVADYSAANF
jgi:hypothetical protein